MNLKSSVANLVKSLDWHPQRCLTFENMILALIDQNNLQHHALGHFLIKIVGNSKATLERIRRFFKDQSIDYEAFAKNIVLKVFSTIPAMDLILDRTNWKFGKKNINYLVLAASIGKLTFPLFWTLLEHGGSSDASSRMELMEKFGRTFGFAKIRSFIADREFIGQHWLEYLYEHKIPFYIRIKDNRLIEWEQYSKRPLKAFFEHLTGEQERTLHTQINQLNLSVVGKKIKGELLVVCSNTTNMDQILMTYRKRWCIETCFRNMKKRGFNLERTHMSDIGRLNKLMAIVAVAILFSTLVGTNEQCPYKRTVNSPLYSIFTSGLRLLKDKLEELDIGRYCLLVSILLKSEG